MYKKLKKLSIAALLLILFAHPIVTASPVTDSHELTSLGSGVYQINFNSSSKWRGFVTGDNNILNRKWYVKYKIKFDTNWNWGSSTYGGGAEYLSNCKVFRMWNPGDVNENVVIALMGWEGQAMATVENVGGDQNVRFLSGYKNLLKAGSTHVWEFEFYDSDVNVANGYIRAWLDNQEVLTWTGIKTREDFSQLKRPYNGGGLENVWTGGSTQGDNTMTVSEIVMAEGKTRAEYLAGSPQPSVPVPQPPAPLPTISGTMSPIPPAPGDTSAIDYFKDFLRKLIAFIQGFLG